MKWFRYLTAALLTAFLLAAPACAAFQDVAEDHWAYESISLAAERGLIQGMTANTFGLGQKVTRAQYATMLCRLMDWTLVSPETGSFSDNQDKSAWYYSAVETAYLHGALLRIGDRCDANEPLSREEMAAMSVRALGYGAAFAGVVQDDCHFEDVTTNPGYIALAYRMGIMNGVSAHRFSPKDASTREQAAAVLLRVYDRLHATITVLSGQPSGDTVAVRSLTGSDAELPLSPRAPLESVYDAAIAANGGAVAINALPYAQSIRNGTVTNQGILSAEALHAMLGDENTQLGRSARYQSSYLRHPEEDGSITVVWYETDADIAVKVDLCRLMGVQTAYILR